jgi:hypothetical protein
MRVGRRDARLDRTAQHGYTGEASFDRAEGEHIAGGLLPLAPYALALGRAASPRCSTRSPVVNEIGEAAGQRAAWCALRVRLFESQFLSHHEADPPLGARADCLHCRLVAHDRQLEARGLRHHPGRVQFEVCVNGRVRWPIDSLSAPSRRVRNADAGYSPRRENRFDPATLRM